MLENLTAYLTLNDIEPQETFLDAGQLILDTPGMQITNLAKKGYILQGFQELAAGEITLEEFMLMGDEGSQRKIYPLQLVDNIEIYLKTVLSVDPKRFENSLLLVDQEVTKETESMLGKSALLVVLP